MSDLLETAVEAHGGLKRWNELDAVSARLVQGGSLLAIGGPNRTLRLGNLCAAAAGSSILIFREGER